MNARTPRDDAAEALDDMNPAWYPIVLRWLAANRPSVFLAALSGAITENDAQIAEREQSAVDGNAGGGS